MPTKEISSWVECFQQLGKASPASAVPHPLPKVNAGTAPLYQDTHCILYEDRLVVTWYFFPHGGNKTIPISHIIKAEQFDGGGMFGTKSWGMAIDFQIWWASDIGREFRSSQTNNGTGVTNAEVPGTIIVNHGKWPKAGFSCNNTAALLEAMSTLLG